MGKKKKICFFFHYMSEGGAEKMTAVLANELLNRGYEVVFLLRKEGESRYNILSPDICVYNMDIEKLPRLKKTIRNIRYLRRIYHDESFDAVFSVTVQMSQLAAFSSCFIKRKQPLICVVHNTMSQEINSFPRLRRMLALALNKKFDRIVSVSEAVRTDYIACCRAVPAKTVTIYNPVVYPELFEKAKQETGHPWLAKNRTWKTLVMAGRLNYQKNHALMFSALAKLREKDDYRLILLGVGELEEELRALASSLKLEDAIDFFGYTQNPYAFFAESDAVILASRFEGLPTVLIEALACGSRVVSTDCPSGPNEILDGGKYGTLVAVNDAAALCAGIETAMSRPLDRELLKKRASDFSLENSVNQYIALLENLDNAEEKI